MWISTAVWASLTVKANSPPPPSDLLAVEPLAIAGPGLAALR
ncbi:MAG: hypothetical protein QM779_15420 [Propionicimonas sp.]